MCFCDTEIGNWLCQFTLLGEQISRRPRRLTWERNVMFHSSLLTGKYKFLANDSHIQPLKDVPCTLQPRLAVLDEFENVREQEQPN